MEHIQHNVNIFYLTIYIDSSIVISMMMINNKQGGVKMEKRITLHRGLQFWMVTFHADAEVMELFGTDTLPTSYTAETPALTVLNAIRALNPGYSIHFGNNAS